MTKDSGKRVAAESGADKKDLAVKLTDAEKQILLYQHVLNLLDVGIHVISGTGC